MIRTFLRETQQKLTDRKTLARLGETKKNMKQLLGELGWKAAFSAIAEKGAFSASETLGAMRPFMAHWADEPEEGWLEAICNEIKASMYPENFTSVATEGQKKAQYFFLENYRALLVYEEEEKAPGSLCLNRSSFR